MWTTKLVAKLCMEQDIFKRSSSDRIFFDRSTLFLTRIFYVSKCLSLFFSLKSFFLASLFTKTFFRALFMSERSFVFEVIIFRIVGLLVERSFFIRCFVI